MVSLYRQGKMTGGLFRCLGQEATAVGSAFALEEGDLLIPMIRDLGATLVRGARPVDILRQVMTKGDAPARGRDGFLHFCLPEKGLYSAIAMLGTAVSVVAGMVLADRYLGKKTVGMTYLGEGGTSTGAFHEGINFAAVQKLPARRRPRVQPLLLLDAVGDAVRRRDARRQGRRLRRRERDRRRERRPRRRRGGPARRGLGARGKRPVPPRVQDVPAEGARRARRAGLRRRGGAGRVDAARPDRAVRAAPRRERR